MGLFQKSAGPEELRCGFCEKSQRQVRKLIAGPRAHICDECIGVSNDLLVKEQAVELAERRAPLPADPAAVLRHFEERLVGQAAAKRAVASALYCQLLRINRPQPQLRVPRLLFVGPRGCGKSELARALTAFSPKLLAYHADASRLTETGYVGENVENLLAALEGLAWAPELAWEGVLFLDGLHHVARQEPAPGSKRDISGVEVQRDLVRLLDGLSCEVQKASPRHPSAQTRTFPCDRLMLAAAATVELEEGVAGDAQLRAALRSAGLVDELLSRFDVIVPMRRLGPAELGQVLQRLAGPTRALLEALGGRLTITAEGADALARRASEQPDGAHVLLRPLARIAELAVVDGQREVQLDAALVARLVA